MSVLEPNWSPRGRVIVSAIHVALGLAWIAIGVVHASSWQEQIACLAVSALFFFLAAERLSPRLRRFANRPLRRQR